MDIGIDLGTTYSVLAVRGNVALATGYPPGEYLDTIDVTMIPSPLGEASFPSVFWASATDPEEKLIGIDAKLKAAEGDSPIMFSKRSIGTDEKLLTGGRPY